MRHRVRSTRSLARLGLAFALVAAVLIPAASSSGAAGPGPGPEELATAERLMATPARGNGLICFTSTRTGNNEIFTMFLDGDSQTNVTKNPAGDTDCAWSPNTGKIAFTSNRSGNKDVWVMNADGSGLTNLTNNPAADSQPTWSGDGLMIAFTSDRAGNNDIWTMNANGTGLRRVTKTDASETQPAWAPNNSRIALSSNKAGNFDVWTIKPSGKGQQNLTAASAASETEPSWSPNSNQILFTTDRDGNNEIYLMSSDGSGVVRKTNKPGSDSQALFSPDKGARILFTTNRTGNNEVYYMRTSDADDPFTLSHQPSASDSQPDWQALPPFVPSGSPIEHVVFLVQENHSFNDVFGRLCVQDDRCLGTEQGKLSDGTIIDLPEAQDLVPKSPHSFDAHTTAINGGEMNGFDLLGPDCAGPDYKCHQAYAPEQIPSLAALARTFALSDMTFETDGTGSYGTHLSLAASYLAGFYKATHHTPDGGDMGFGVGCDSGQIGAWQGNVFDLFKSEPTCVPHEDGSGPFEDSAVHWAQTIMGRMTQQGMPWRLYGAPFPAAGNGYGWSICPTFADCLLDPAQKQFFVGRDEFFTDAAAGNLPRFSFLIPDNDPSQHNSRSMILGDNWIADVANAVMTGPDWQSTALFISYDDAGIFYDPVPPPPSLTGAYYLGIRMPMVIISPWARPGYTDSNIASFNSVLAFAERTFGLAPLTTLDAVAYDYANTFDFTQSPIEPISLKHHPVPAWQLQYMKTHPVHDEDDPT